MGPRFPRRRILASLAAGALLLTGGCATNGDPRDPIEPFNRAMDSFNRHVDELALKPAATLYHDAVPDVVRTGVNNFFENLRDVIAALNNLLQGKFEQSMSDVSRVAFNTTIGIGGLIDVATPMGYERHHEDFGQTLGVWGVGNGAYVVLPFLGPKTVRDTVGLVGDYFVHPLNQVEGPGARNAFWAGDAIDTRHGLLDADKVLEEGAIDRYNFVRDAYLQRRRNMLYDGSPPREPEDEDK